MANTGPANEEAHLLETVVKLMDSLTDEKARADQLEQRLAALEQSASEAAHAAPAAQQSEPNHSPDSSFRDYLPSLTTRSSGWQQSFHRLSGWARNVDNKLARLLRLRAETGFVMTKVTENEESLASLRDHVCGKNMEIRRRVDDLDNMVMTRCNDLSNRLDEVNRRVRELDMMLR